MLLSRIASKSLLPLATAAALFTTGCALSPTAAPSSTVIPAISGVVHGGQNPFQGSAVTLYKAGSSYAAGATSIGTATTAADGSFNIAPSATSSDCPTGTQAYITAAGGFQTGNANTNNPSALMMAALGDCKNISSTTNITINEVTTVAAAYALSGFMTATSGSAIVGGPSQGLAHAFLNAAALANYTTGTPNATAPSTNLSPASVTGTIPAAEINTLGNIMQACINSDSSSVSQTCTNLFLDTPSISGNLATNTLQAFINLARNPASSAAIAGSASTVPAMTTLLGLASATPAFQTSLGTAPADWSLSIVYTGGNIAPGYWLTLDQYDTPYVDLYSYTGNTQSPILFGVSPYGRTIPTFANNPNYNATTPGTNTTTRGIAADALGNVWVAIDNASTGFSTAYQFYAPTGAFNRSFSDAYAYSFGLAVDSSNNLWVGHADTAGHVVEGVWNGLTTGAAWSAALDVTSLGYYGSGIAVDSSQNVWLAADNAASTTASLLPAMVLKEVTATATATLSGSGVSAASITVPGYYYATPTLTFSGGGCTTTPTGLAVLNATPGPVSSITVTNSGAGCTSAPTIAFSTALTPAAGTAVLSGATVGSVTITKGGYYAAVPTVTFTNGGCTNAATGTAVLTSNAVSSVTINTAGVGCTSAPTVTFSNPMPAMIAATLPDSLMNPYGISIDGSGNAWYTILNSGTPAVSGVVEATASGSTSITTPTYIVATTAGTGAYAGNTLGIGSAEESAIDGAGTMFLGDVSSTTVGLHAFSTVTNGYILSPTKGFTGYSTSGTSPMTSARSIAIDSTGSVWLDSSTVAQVTQVIGIAAPTVPLLAAGKSGTAPGAGVLPLP